MVCASSSQTSFEPENILQPPLPLSFNRSIANASFQVSTALRATSQLRYAIQPSKLESAMHIQFP
jgi:hypothetical protein